MSYGPSGIPRNLQVVEGILAGVDIEADAIVPESA